MLKSLSNRGLLFHSQNIFSGDSFDADAIALFNQWKDIGEEPSPAQKLSYSNTIKLLKASNNWDWIDGLIVYHSHADAACYRNWRRDMFHGIKVNNPVFTERDGIVTNGTDSGVRFEWNFENAIKAQRDSCTLIINSEKLDNLDAFEVGVYDSATSRLSVRWRASGALPRFGACGTVVSITGIGDTTTKNGWLGVTRNDDASIRGFVNNASGLLSNVSAAPPELFYLACGAGVWNGTQFVSPTSNKYKLQVWGSGITQQQYDDFIAIMDAFFLTFPVEYPNDQFYTDNFLIDFPTDNSLSKIAIMGDSLNANALGGVVPAELDEGVGYRPIRLGFNSVARRIYDKISTNKATHIRLDAAEWNKTGTWLEINDLTAFIPNHNNTKYHETSTQEAYCEISVPDGNDNFAFICQRDAGYDTLIITLNGGSIEEHGPVSVNCNRAKDNASDIGNPFYTVQYTNLPSGLNTIRISKGNNTNKARVWGGFYWSGKTIVVHNIATGGQSMQRMILRYLNAMMVENNFDAILFQIPLMNELSHGRTNEQSIADLANIVNNYIGSVNYLLITCNPLGSRPDNPEINYYTFYSDPSMEQKADVIKLYAKEQEFPYFDLFQFFKRQIITDGGTLENGNAGVYTTDGQHPNPAGVEFWWNTIKKFFN